MCDFIAISARRGKIGPAAYVGAPSRRDFDVEAFYRTLSMMGKCFKPIRAVSKIDLMCHFIAISAGAPSDGLFVAQEAPGGLRVCFIVLYVIEQVY